MTTTPPACCTSAPDLTRLPLAPSPASSQRGGHARRLSVQTRAGGEGRVLTRWPLSSRPWPQASDAPVGTKRALWYDVYRRKAHPVGAILARVVRSQGGTPPGSFGQPAAWSVSGDAIGSASPMPMTLWDIVRRVVIDPRKLTEYARDPDNPIGRHTARVFERASVSRKAITYRWRSS